MEGCLEDSIRGTSRGSMRLHWQTVCVCPGRRGYTSACAWIDEVTLVHMCLREVVRLVLCVCLDRWG